MDHISKMTLQVLQRLEALRIEHISLMSGMGDGYRDPDKYGIIKKSIENLESGLSEAQVMMELASHFQNLEATKEKLNTENRLLHQENAWLREELTYTKKNLQVSEKLAEQLEKEKKHWEFMANLKQCDYENNQKENYESSCSELTLDFYPEVTTADDSTIMSPTPTPSQFAMHTCANEIPARLRTLNDLVIKYASQGRFEVAVPLCEQAIEDLEKAKGRNNPDVATMLNILALVYRDQEKYKEAESLLVEALSIREKVLGEHHPAVAATLNSLAVLYDKRGMYKDAEQLCKRALCIREIVLGRDHPGVAKQLNKLALLSQKLGKYDEMEKYYQRALEIYESKLGPNDPNVAKTKSKLASGYLRQDRYAEAEKIYSQNRIRANNCEIVVMNGKNKSMWDKVFKSLSYWK